MKRVFIIEDDRDIVELVRYNLANEGYQVTAAYDGVTGLATLKKTPPDILLLDLMLPKLSGLEICREIRRDEGLNRLPILMLTARGEEAYRVSQSGRPVVLSTLEFRLLYYLASRPNRVFTRDQLLDAVWGTDRFVTPRSVDVYVRRLREKIEADPENPLHLKTVRGAGYLFETRAA